MVRVFKAPTPVIYEGKKSVFLAGTIDDGRSVDWQVEVESALSHLDICILNPRRDDWDDTWEQSINNPQFKEQVEWELAGLASSTLIFLYFAPKSLSPISLLELGLHAASKKIIIVCPEGFWRRGNIEVIAEQYDIPLFHDMQDGLNALQTALKQTDSSPD